MITRRSAVAALAAGTLAAKPFKHPIGVNLYTVRDLLGKEPERTYQRLKQVGIELIQVRPNHLKEHAAFFRAAGLRPVHMMIDSTAVFGQPALLDEMIGLAKEHKLQRIGTSFLAPKDRETAIEAFAKAADACAKGGVELYYHNHAYEFAGEKGQRFIDRLHRDLDRRVRLELDVFWASISGNSPEQMLGEWKGRVKSLHLKDLAKGTPVTTNERDMKPPMIQELGNGSLNFPAILRAAEKAGVENYLIELDFSAGDAVDSVGRCVEYLRRVSF